MGIKSGIVCGYGNILDDNFTGYMNSVTSFVREHEIETLILTGGCTFTHSTLSEAKLMSEWFHKQNLKLDLILEERAITTLHNLLYSRHIIQQLNLEIDNLYIFCDRARFCKLSLLARAIFKTLKFEVVKIGRQEPFFVYWLQIPSTICQLLGIFFPTVERKLLIDKQKWIEKFRSVRTIE